MPNVIYNGKLYKFPYTKRGKQQAKALKRRSRNSMSVFSCGDNSYKLMNRM